MVRIEPFEILYSDTAPARLRAELLSYGLRPKTVEQLLHLPEECAYQIKHLAELRAAGQAPRSAAAWLRRAVEGRYRFGGPPRAAARATLFDALLEEEHRIEAEVTEEERAWKATLDGLQHRMSRSTYERWFPGSSLRHLDDQSAIVAVTTPAAREWLEHRLLGHVQAELQAVLGRPVAVTVEVHQDGAPTPSYQPSDSG